MFCDSEHKQPRKRSQFKDQARRLVSGETQTMADVQALARLVRELLNDRLTDDAEVKVDRFDSGGANYTSALFKVCVQNDLHLFAKVASFSESMRAKINADWMYSNEQFVYTDLAKTYGEIQQRHGVPEEHQFVFPNFFGCSSEHGRETIVIEDLAANGYSSYDRLASMDWEYASTSVTVLAKFHALSFAFEHEQPDKFQKIADNMEYKLGSDDDETMKSLWVQMVEGSVSALDADYKERVRKLLYDEKTMKGYNKPLKKIVLAHGDYRLSNLMFKKKDGILHALAVDYQMVHAGCPLGDLMYFITVGSDKEFRARYFHQLVDHYRQQLALALDRYSLDIEDVYPRKTFDAELLEIMPHVVLIGVMILPAVVVEAGDAPKLNDDSADVSSFMMKPNKLFTERFNGIVEDCINWGVI